MRLAHWKSKGTGNWVSKTFKAIQTVGEQFLHPISRPGVCLALVPHPGTTQVGRAHPFRVWDSFPHRHWSWSCWLYESKLNAGSSMKQLKGTSGRKYWNGIGVAGNGTIRTPPPDQWRSKSFKQWRERPFSSSPGNDLRWNLRSLEDDLDLHHSVQGTPQIQNVLKPRGMLSLDERLAITSWPYRPKA